MALSSSLSPSVWGELNKPAFQELASLIAAAGGQARLVGGCVRDALLGRPVGDFDLATDLPPLTTISTLETAGLKVVPTGLAHGTVTALVDHKPFEITTLRRDISTDGRHAQIAPTKEWHVDAQRRDFTINALYVDQQGQLYDYCGGLADLDARRLRFIGDPRARMDEDILRLLRFFRFTALLDPLPPDAATLCALKEKTPFLTRLSPERLGQELHKLLAAPQPLAAWRLMEDCCVLEALPFPLLGPERMEALCKREQAWHAAPDPLRRLAGLTPEAVQVERVCHALRLSKKEQNKFTALTSFTRAPGAPWETSEIQALCYKLKDPELVRAGLILAGAPPERAAALLPLPLPVFPLRARDLIQDLGLTEGPLLGQLLKEGEQFWQAHLFAPSKEDCLFHVKKVYDQLNSK